MLAATLISANCADVVPNSYMWRCAASAYVWGAPAIPQPDSNPASDPDAKDTSWRPVRGFPANVINATEHLPAAIAAAA